MKPATKQTNDELLESYTDTRKTNEELEEVREEIVKRWVYYAAKHDIPQLDTAADTYRR